MPLFATRLWELFSPSYPLFAKGEGRIKDFAVTLQRINYKMHG